MFSKKVLECVTNTNILPVLLRSWHRSGFKSWTSSAPPRCCDHNCMRLSHLAF